MRISQLSCLANPRCAGPEPARPPRRALGRWRTDHNAARTAPSRRMGRRRTSVRRGPPGPASSRDEAATATVRPCAVAHGSQHGQDRSLATRGPRMGERSTKGPVREVRVCYLRDASRAVDRRGLQPRRTRGERAISFTSFAGESAPRRSSPSSAPLPGLRRGRAVPGRWTLDSTRSAVDEGVSMRGTRRARAVGPPTRELIALIVANALLGVPRRVRDLGLMSSGQIT